MVVLAAGGIVAWLGGGGVLPVALAANDVATDADRVVAVQRAAMAAVAPVAAAVAEVGGGREPAPRCDGGPVDEPRVAAWVRDLRDDGVPWNAEAAQWRLVALPPGSVPALERALASTDLQQRHLAALVLRRRCAAHGEAASPRLLAVTVEALADWLHQQLAERRLCGDWNPSAEGTRFLAPHAVAARAALQQGLGSGDAQQRFLCAWLLAQSGDVESAATICRELLPHLLDNDIAGDAVMAANGLYRLGPAALPTLQWWRQTHDAQARSLLDLVIADLQQPPGSRAELVRRGHGQAATRVYWDPAIEYDVQRSWVPSWRSW